ncbi:deleted in malignant brain tumors 1 protein-like isoform X2 [Synchiropus splendidus]|uniref:deleted in malignant brain tumors 1 protein-like isoform X2 n=1 Tax=Synchiropus splendidus TaxID=270530 RepID=UPI00237EA731|nr:deleted in malignant brain tumors 1 protein-like isoform X2 [Synchiropus splendidus]
MIITSHSISSFTGLQTAVSLDFISLYPELFPRVPAVRSAMKECWGALVLFLIHSVAPVTSAETALYSVRLVNGETACEGRVEVYKDGQWGTVCDDHWDMKEADVVCRQAGCGEAKTAAKSALFGKGSGEIWLHNVECAGTESSISGCRHGVGKHNCDHSNDAGVRCQGPPTAGAVRLVNGETTCEGRVEVYKDGQWGTVCDDHWDMKEADVVCRQAGCGKAKTAAKSALYGKGSGEIWLHNVECAGTESSISGCRHGVGQHNCDHSNDAGVSCQGPPTAGAMRLVNGETACEGRVEVYNDGQWGTVCDDHWDMKEADVVCRQAGCGKAKKADKSARFGEGSGEIWLHNVECAGTESSISSCRHGVGQHNCDHSNDAGVSCQGPPTAGAVRLVNGETACEGRVEVYKDGQWGTVCDDHWDMKEAGVVCRQAGCGKAKTAAKSALFGKGSGEIWLHNVECAGIESSISGCRHGVGQHNCDHSNDAGVRCQEPDPPGTLRLVDGNNRCQGRVEIFLNGKWGTVCDDSWSMEDAQVVCRQLGCGPAIRAPISMWFGMGKENIWLDEVHCQGTESSLMECNKQMGVHDCKHTEDASVICQDEPTLGITDLRLANGKDRCQGRVEVLVNGQWGTVCGNHWGLEQAMVICRQLSCGKAVSAPTNAHFGEGEGEIWLSKVECTGEESCLGKCKSLRTKEHNCQHSDDASVVCQGKSLCLYFSTGRAWLVERLSFLNENDKSNFTDFYNPFTAIPTLSSSLRLMGGERECEGRVEILYGNSWGTVCDDHWGMNEAQVVCRQLGCGDATEAPISAYFGGGNGVILLDNVECTGEESVLTLCRHSPVGHHNCKHSEDASVVCEDKPTPGSKVKLVGGSHECEGRVEIQNKGKWGSVCADDWGQKEAEVVCRQLGCGKAKSEQTSAQFGESSGSRVMDNIECTGMETSLTHCKHTAAGNGKCQVDKDAVVVCEAKSTPEAKVRLVGGSNECEGRVEIKNGNAWGTVCDDAWGLADAQVVCQQLGCGKAKGAPTKAQFGKGSGPILLDNVECKGTESSLTQCKHHGIGKHNCIHDEDASAICEAKPAPGSKVRLVGGKHKCEGRVEVQHKGSWGTVCNKYWGLKEAAVVCQQVGCGAATSAETSAQFGPSSGSIMLDDIECSGEESDLTQCKHTDEDKHSCTKGEDASVTCEVKPATGSKVKLVGGRNKCEGRVEVLHGDSWGTVCKKGWGLNQAKVVCRQVGCGEATSSETSAQFGPSSGSILLDNIECSGDELSLALCKVKAEGKHTCSKDEDAGVTCEAKPAPGSKVKLVGGRNKCEGRVEVLHKDRWGTVCKKYWGLNEAKVVCRQVGCGDATSSETSAQFGPSSGSIVLDNIECSGDELSLALCKVKDEGKHTCSKDEDAGVTCEVKPATGSKVKLVGGKNKCEGRVEVLHGDSWGTVCKKGWGLNQAKVVCRQVGCGEATSSETSAQFGPSSGSILLDNIECSGDESSLALCKVKAEGKHTCSKDEDAGVTCEVKPAPGSKVKLVGGKNKCEGRVEVLHKDRWGTVCKKYWGLNEAKVVCRQVGCGDATSSETSVQFGPSSGSFVLDDIQCSGDELSLTHCLHKDEGKHRCSKGEDAGVTCEVKPATGSKVKLVGGRNKCEGRVEVLHEDSWGTVCKKGWGLNQAKVVCRQVGCGEATSSETSAQFGPSSGSILLDDIECSGDESSLALCKVKAEGKHTCNKGEDAGVTCEVKPAPGSKVKLVGGKNKCEGRVEVLHKDSWGTVCKKDWGLNEARVVCRQVGCGKATSAETSAQFSPSSGSILLDKIVCSGHESSLSLCKLNDEGKHSCSKGEDAGVTCEDEITLSGNVRLVGGKHGCEGRVELQYGDSWGCVCDDFWGIKDAQVVCQQVGCGDAISPQTGGRFGQGTGLILLDNVNCEGTESSLAQCKHGGVGIHNCRLKEAAGVVCGVKLNPEAKVRLVGGSHECEGRVELQYGNSWGTVCDDFWGFDDAQVVCRQLGCGEAVNAQTDGRFGPGTGLILLDNVKCAGTESYLAQCKHAGAGKSNCRHKEDAGVICGRKLDLTGNIRLAGGSNECEGRVELQYGDQWGTVCDDFWGIEDAQVVCRQLGCGEVKTAKTVVSFGPGSGVILLDNVKCEGTESSLTQCKHGGVGKHNCRAKEAVGIICTPKTTLTGNVRLAGGSHECEGRVELQYGDQWGTVCDDFWGIKDAQVVCRQLGCGEVKAAKTVASFGPGSGVILLDNVNCEGTESSLTQCKHGGVGKHNCRAKEAVGITCTRGDAGDPVRLVGMDSECSGRVEVFHDNQWGTVCNDFWDIKDANVVCRQLGCGSAVAAIKEGSYEKGTGLIWLDNVRCQGDEKTLTACTHAGFGKHNCRHREDAGVICGAKYYVSQDSEVSCQASILQVRVSAKDLERAGLDKNSGRMAQSTCNAHSFSGDLVVYQIPKRENVCGTTMTNNGTHFIYTNVLVFKSIIGSEVQSIPFSCAYPLRAITALKIAARSLPENDGQTAAEGSQPKAEMLVYENKCEGQPLAVGTVNFIHEKQICIQVTLPDSVPVHSGVLHELYATHSPSPSAAEKDYYIASRCPTDGWDVVTIKNDGVRQVQVTGELGSADGVVYIHGLVGLCNKNSQQCAPDCSEGAAHSSDDLHDLPLITFGPIEIRPQNQKS